MLGGHASGLHPMAGIGFGVATSAAYACFLLIMRTTSGHAPHVAGQLADATIGATAGTVVLGLIAGGLQLGIPWPSFGWLLILALLSQTVGWLLITSALPRLPAAISSLLLLLQPAAAMVLADIVLSERPTLTQVGGAVVVCAGVLFVARAPVKASTVEDSSAHGEQHIAIAEPGGRRLAAEPSRSHVGRELNVQHSGEVCVAGEAQL
jgi:drug/metabolite transporter (DMT)-like permease